MKYQIIYSPLAGKQRNEIILWYAERSLPAMENFIIELDTVVKGLYLNPQRFRKTYKNYHQVALKKFPYYVIYSVKEQDGIVIIASIWHHKRSSRKKYSNL
ncbi:type II toxin-antitoxin system RelE/ParE family toxin [Parafilimonas sp.]|uniref:type II toxin-antitoxin system RelE/ParE family toxin n=1 Tax=Parafilimonas sp. TaxID=1969739 RepID=UPI0039E247E9